MSFGSRRALLCVGRPPSSEALTAHGDDKASQLFRLASAQHGVVTAAQMAKLGFSASQVTRLLTRGRIRAVARGVYAIGHARTDLKSAHAAALLMAGQGAYLFRRSAALQLDLPVKRPIVPEVGIPAHRSVRHEGLTVFRSSTIDRALDVRKVERMPTTTVARTLVDLAGVLTKRELTRVCERAAFRNLLHDDEVIDCLRRARNARGTAQLRSIVTQGKLEGSGFERQVIDALAAAGAPAPLLQERFLFRDGTPFHPDLCWHTHRLVVEVDGPHHLHPVFAAKDAKRDAVLRALGYTVLRISDKAWKADASGQVRRVLTEL